MIHKKENRPKVKELVERLKDLQRIDLNRAKTHSRYVLQKRRGNLEELSSSEEEIDSLQKEIDSIKKVIRKLKREK